MEEDLEEEEIEGGKTVATVAAAVEGEEDEDEEEEDDEEDEIEEEGRRGEDADIRVARVDAADMYLNDTESCVVDAVVAGMQGIETDRLTVHSVCV